MATASRGRCDTWDMGIGASGRSLSGIEVPNARELPFWVAQQPEGECGVTPISRFEKGGPWKAVAEDSVVVAHMYPRGARQDESTAILTGARAGEKEGCWGRNGGGSGRFWEAERRYVAGRKVVRVNLGTREIHAWECIRAASFDVCPLEPIHRHNGAAGHLT